MHAADCQKVFPQCGPQEIDLEFGGDYLAPGWGLGQRCISARAIQNAGDRARMDIAVLLGNLRGERQRYLHLTIGYRGELCTDGRHQALGEKAVGDSFVNVAHLGL